MRLRPALLALSVAVMPVMVFGLGPAVPGARAADSGARAADGGAGVTLRHEVVFAPAWSGWPTGGDAGGASLTDEPGDPRVPYRDVTLLLPPGRKVAEVLCSPRDPVARALTAAIATAGPAAVSGGGEVAWDRLPADGPAYPPCWGELLGEALWHGYRLAFVRVYPWQLTRSGAAGWDGARGAAAVTIELTLAPATDGISRRRPVPAEDARVRERLAALVANPVALAAYPAPGSVAPRADGGFAPTWAPSQLGDDVAYLIVTSAALAAEFQRLADYKTARGVPTVVRTTEEITAASPTGIDLPGLIRAYFADAYRDWGTRAVLLGGDTQIVPARRILNTLYPAGEGTDMPVDLYYGCLDGDWNADRDERLGEAYINSYDPGDWADLAAELAVGRAPVSTAAEAAVFVDKIIAYESGAAAAPAGRALFLSEVLFPSTWTTGTAIVDDGATYSEAIINDVLAAAPAAPVSTRMYEATALWPGSVAERRAAVIDSLNTGHYALVNHIGHGFFYDLSVGDATLGLKDAAGLHNRNSYFVLNSLNCSSSAFDYNCILERLILNPDGGAVATIGSARAAFPVTASQYQREFYAALFRDGIHEVGEAVAACRLPFAGLTAANTPERWTHMTLTLLGDPTLAMWTATPVALTVTAPDTLPLGGQEVTVKVVRGGLPAAGAMVCLGKAGESYARALTDAAGEARLPVVVKSGGGVALSVTAVDSRPVTRTIPVSVAPSPYLKVTGVQFRDDGTLGSVGNGDGLPDAGETVALVPTFTNSGTVVATGAVSVAAWTTTPGTALLSTVTAVPALAPGASAVGTGALLLRLDSAVRDGTSFTVQLSAADGGHSYVDEISERGRAPDLRPTIMSWLDWPGGDGDGVLEANEEIALRFTLVNRGGGRASGLTATVEPGTGLTVVDGAGAWPDIAPGGEAEPSDPVSVRPASPVSAARGTLVVRDAYGHEWRQRFDLTPPAQPTITSATSPAGGECLLLWTPNSEADLYGYHVYRSLEPNFGYVRLTSEPINGGSFYRDTGLASLTRYYYQVAAVDSSRLLSRLSVTAAVSTVPSEQIGFPIALPVETSSHPAVGDVNGDGRLEIVLPADYIYVWDAEGVELRDGDGDSQTLGPFNSLAGDWNPAGATLANLTTRPGLEIIASNRTTRQIFVYQGDGSVAPGWPRTMNDWNWATPVAGDLDGDGQLEVIANTVSGTLYVWRHDGTDFFDGDNNPATIGVFQVRVNEWYSFCSPALADLDGDGRLEIILGTRYSGTTALDVLMALRNDATNLPGFPVSFGPYGEVLCSPAVGDLDGDGRLEIVAVTENDRLQVIRYNGTSMAPFPIVFVSNNNSDGVSTPSPALADLDADGHPEIVAVSVTNSLTASVYAISRTGATLAGWPRPVGGNSESSPVVADITGDGRPDVLFGIGGGADSSPNALYAWRHDGAAVPGFPLLLSGPVRPTPCLTDLNGDGDVDIVYGGWDLQMHVWDLPAAWNADVAFWPTFKGNPLRTGLAGQLWITAVDPGSDGGPPSAASLEGNRPNPFNPRTRIDFVLPGPGAVRTQLTVYDVRGRRVARLVDGVLPPGRDSREWGGL
ncbi:MAG: C25 family cysteine peptidase, partial [Candidatus Krumholzibacteriia bacterium]